MNIIGISGLNNSVAFKQKHFPGLSPRHYRICQGLDSAAALVTAGGIVAAAAEERFNGSKGTGLFPAGAIEYCLQAGGLHPEDLDFVAHGFDYEPYRTYFEQSDLACQQFKQVYSRQAQLDCLQAHFPAIDWSNKFIGVPHHLAHAASTFYLSGFQEALILVADAMGEVHSTTVALGQGNRIEIIRQVPALHSLGLLYGICTHYLGFVLNFDEYKVMGMAPYGNARRYFNRLMELVHLKSDGTYTLPLLFQNNTPEEQETYQGSLNILAESFGPPRQPGEPITQDHMDFAAALQAVLQVCLMHILRHFKKETGQSNLCLAGGVALNCTANGVIWRSRMFRQMFIQPAAGDDGSALGAALYVRHNRQEATSVASLRRMDLPLWGPEYSNSEIEKVLQGREDCSITGFNSFDDLGRAVAGRIAAGEVVAWFQGRMEFGPRALGNRSILADPRRPGMRDHVNQLIKQREDFRPLAPAVTAEAAARFFEMGEGEESLFAYMLLVAPVRPEYRSQLPAITHVDGSARLQVVSRDQNPRFWRLLNIFGELAGDLPVLLNTSFNLRGQPIIRTPGEALDTFLISGIDALVLGDYLVERQKTTVREV